MANTFKNYGAQAVGTSPTTIVTASTSTTVIGLTIANIVTNTITTSITVTSGATTYYLVKDAVVPVGGALVPIGGEQKLVLETGDLLRVTTSLASSADVICSVLEIS